MNADTVRECLRHEPFEPFVIRLSNGEVFEVRYPECALGSFGGVGARQFLGYHRSMSTAPRYQPHYTVDDYQHWEGRWELWHGLAVAMSPSPFGRHAKLLARMVALLQGAVDAAGCAATVLVEIDWIVSRDTVLRPDVIVVCGPEPARHVERTPPLVVEILSETTRERDLDFKLELYREQGVAWYLVVDPEAGHIRGLSLTADRRYVDRFAVGDPEPLTIDICDGCELSLDVTRLFA